MSTISYKQTTNKYLDQHLICVHTKFAINPERSFNCFFSEEDYNLSAFRTMNYSLLQISRTTDGKYSHVCHFPFLGDMEANYRVLHHCRQTNRL